MLLVKAAGQPKAKSAPKKPPTDTSAASSDGQLDSNSGDEEATGKKKYCTKHLSPDGCTFGRRCVYSHHPLKSADEVGRLAKVMLKHKIEFGPAFLKLCAKHSVDTD